MSSHKGKTIRGAGSKVVVGGKRRRLTPALRLKLTGLVGIGVGLLIVVILITFLISRHVGDSDTTSSTMSHSAQCGQSGSNSLLKEAAGNLSPAQSASLAPIVQKIMKVPDYKNDPNCLYPVVVYYINMGDATNGRTYLDAYKSAYSMSATYKSYFGNATIAPADLESSVALLEQQAKDASDNIITSGQP
jgi:hypothetical protein